MWLEIIPTPFRVTRTFMGNHQLWNHLVSLKRRSPFQQRKRCVPLTFDGRLANITGLGSWANSLSRAQAMVSNMTLDEKVSNVSLLEHLHIYSRRFLCTDQSDSRLD